MNISITKSVSVVFTILFLTVFFIFDEELVFTSYKGLIMSGLWIVSLFSSMRAILEFNDKEIINTIKLRESIYIVPFILVIMFGLISLVYYVDTLGYLSSVSVITIIGLMILVIVYLIISLFMHYAVIQEDGFKSRFVINIREINIKYDEIISIQFGFLTNTLHIKTKEKTVFLDVGLSNIHVLLNALYHNTTSDVHKKAFDDLARYYRLYFLKKNLKMLDYYNKIEK